MSITLVQYLGIPEILITGDVGLFYEFDPRAQPGNEYLVFVSDGTELRGVIDQSIEIVRRGPDGAMTRAAVRHVDDAPFNAQLAKVDGRIEWATIRLVSTGQEITWTAEQTRTYRIEHDHPRLRRDPWFAPETVPFT